MGSAASRGAPAHALTSSADAHAAAHLLHSRARRICFFLAPMTCFGTAQKPSPGVHIPLARRVNPIRTTLTAALRDDCCFFAAVSHFAEARLLHPARRFCCCVAIRAGWKMTAAARVVSSDRAIAFGSLWFSHHPGTSSMGKLMALVQALKRMARVRLDCRKFVSPERHATM